MQRKLTPVSWSVGFNKGAETRPERFVPATVPGAVQLDWAAAEGWPPHFVADEWKRYRWMEDAWWTYRAAVPATELALGERLVFVAKGIDYRFAIRLNGRVLHEQEGMFTPVELDLTEHAAVGGELEVLVHPAPKSQATPESRDQANQSCKPAVSYGWDFHPRLIPLGMWDEAYLEVRPRDAISQLETWYELSRDLSRARVQLRATVSARKGGIDVDEAGRMDVGRSDQIRFSLIAPDGAVVETHQESGWITIYRNREFQIDQPVLWWPHDQGEPALYTGRVELIDAEGNVFDVEERRIGFRTVRLVMNEGAWAEPKGFPKSRSVPPFQLEINGRCVFGKGANWVTPDIFPGTITRERYREHLELAKGANMNLLRCWGGAAVSKDDFFELCDEMGIMVWQEFPLACNRYEGTPEYLRVLDHESRSIITRLREHACLVMWCGGNELFNGWSLMTDQDLALRLLNRNCYDLDPHTPFLPTSPVMGVGHGHYVFRDPTTGEEAWEIFQRSRYTAYTEFGCPGPASVEVLETFIPPEDRFPPRKGTAWETHHAFGVWQPTSWLNLPTCEHYFGESDALEKLVACGQWLQSEGYKGLFEEVRRQRPYASMALNWCFNEPWPSAANNSLVSWPAVAKPALAAVGEALRPALASAKVRKFAWKEGELFDPEIWLLSDDPYPVKAGRVSATLRCAGAMIPLVTWDFAEIGGNQNLRGPRAQLVLPSWDASVMELVLDVEGRPGLRSVYRLPYQQVTKPKEPATRTLNT